MADDAKQSKARELAALASEELAALNKPRKDRVRDLGKAMEALDKYRVDAAQRIQELEAEVAEKARLVQEDGWPEEFLDKLGVRKAAGTRRRRAARGVA